MCDRARYGPSFVLTKAAVVDGDTVRDMPQALLLFLFSTSLSYDMCDSTSYRRHFPIRESVDTLAIVY